MQTILVYYDPFRSAYTNHLTILRPSLECDNHITPRLGVRSPNYDLLRTAVRHVGMGEHTYTQSMYD